MGLIKAGLVAMNGFIGMGMAGGAMGGGFNAAQQFYNAGVQQQQQFQQSVPNPAAAPSPAAAMGWKCACGATATGKFCPECGAKKPEPQAASGWTCSCGAVNTGKFCSECGAKKPQGSTTHTSSSGTTHGGGKF